MKMNLKEISASIKLSSTLVGIYSLWLLSPYIIENAYRKIFPIIDVIYFAILPQKGLSVIPILLSMILLVNSIGILKLRNWCRILTIFCSALISLSFSFIIIIWLYFVLMGKSYAVGVMPGSLINLVPTTFLWIFLSRSKIKKQFKK